MARHAYGNAAMQMELNRRLFMRDGDGIARQLALILRTEGITISEGALRELVEAARPPPCRG